MKKHCERCYAVDSIDNPIFEMLDEYGVDVEEWICMGCYIELIEEESRNG